MATKHSMDGLFGVTISLELHSWFKYGTSAYFWNGDDSSFKIFTICAKNRDKSVETQQSCKNQDAITWSIGGL